MLHLKKAYSPAGISGFFAPYINPTIRETGSIGGGVTIKEGITVEVYDSPDEEVHVYINGKKMENSLAEYVTLKLMNEADISTGLTIRQTIKPPIGYGYGTSAASAIATGLAVARYLNINKTLYDIGRIAHETEIIFRTGLGTVQGILNPGIVLIRRHGEPGEAFVDNIIYDEEIYVITGWYRPIDTKQVLEGGANLEYLKYLGEKTMEKILKDPTPQNLMLRCWEYAQKAGFLTPTLENIIKTIWNIDGVIGVTQNMIGEAFFALAYKEALEETRNVLEEAEENLIITKITDEKPSLIH